MAGRDYMGIQREKIPWCPRVDADKCVGCGECLETCPNNVFVMNEQTGKVEVANPDNCVVLCDKCAGFCPQEAISFPDKEVTKKLVGKLLREMLKEQKGGKP
jgi:NAD-dependent dihydropyrimidine dehydrogenase PreA subunit